MEKRFGRFVAGVDGIVRSRAFVPVCLLVALAVRLIWATVFDPTPVSDFGWYHARAIDMAAGAGYTVDGVPTAYWPVGYPATLAAVFRLFGPSLLAARILNALLSTLAERTSGTELQIDKMQFIGPRATATRLHASSMSERTSGEEASRSSIGFLPQSNTTVS